MTTLLPEKTLITTTEALRRLDVGGVKAGLGTLVRLLGSGHLTEYGKPHNGHNGIAKTARFNHAFDVVEIDKLIVSGIPRPKRRSAPRAPRAPRQIALPLELATLIRELNAEVAAMRHEVAALRTERTRDGNQPQ